MNKLFLLFNLLFILPLLSCAQVDEENTITVEELKQQLETDSTLVLVDVRTDPELTGPLGHIPGIIHIPLQELNERFTELEAYKNQPIAIICRSGNRSGVATKLLLEKGFKVKNVAGGMKAWNKIQ